MYSLRWNEMDEYEREEIRDDYFNMSHKDFYRKWDRQQSTFSRFFWPKKTYKFSVNEETIRDWGEMPVQDFCRKHHITNKTASRLLANYPSNTNSARRKNERAIEKFWCEWVQKMIIESGVKVTIETTGISKSYIYANFKTWLQKWKTL